MNRPDWRFRRRVAILYGLAGVIISGTARLAKSGLGVDVSDLIVALIAAATGALLGLVLPRSWIPSAKD
ncbi:hypothetical protein [Streptomyces sp. NBC_00198]|uniref:hypothetical protein n=1 Tax=Streptomyces sp. NBC_00198 TaxID=2975677 RepID=UPI00225B2EAD|nr:hypothetical protein [Streptomyces sp. NBC_00198]MCX5280788.1 hypothetical protein [Streptomyces sp. NBC_00198]